MGALCFLLPMLLAIASGAAQLRGVIAGGLVNPDTYMRLVRLEATLRQQSAVYVVDRDGSGTGALLHWSHLLDSLLTLLAAPFGLLLDQHAALHVAAAMLGPLSIGALGLGLAWAIAPLVERRWLWLAPIVAALSPPIVSYGLPGEAHHHVLLVLVAVMTSGYALRAALGQASAGSGLAMGAWAGVGIWLSPESMPLSLMAFAGLWLTWLLSEPPRAAGMIQATAGSFLLVIVAAFAVDPPYAGYAAIEIDRLSLVYVALAIALGIAAVANWMIDAVSLPPAARSIAALAVPALCLLLWIACFPSVVRGPDGLMPAQETAQFLGNIVEMQPVSGITTAVLYLLTGGLAALWLLLRAFRQRSILLGYVAVCTLVLLALGASHIRFAAYACAAGSALLPILVAHCTESLAGWAEPARALVRVALLALFILAPRAQALLFTPAQAATVAPSCSVAGLTDLLAPYHGQVVLAHVNDSPELLYRTQVLTVASLYHRNVAAFLRWRAAWTATDLDTLPDAVRQTGASLLLFCPGRWSPGSNDAALAARLLRGEVPPWLRRLGEDRASGNVLYGVIAHAE